MFLFLVQICKTKHRVDISPDAYYVEYLNKINYIFGHVIFGVQKNECRSKTSGKETE